MGELKTVICDVSFQGVISCRPDDLQVTDNRFGTDFFKASLYRNKQADLVYVVSVFVIGINGEIGSILRSNIQGYVLLTIRV